MPKTIHAGGVPQNDGYRPRGDLKNYIRVATVAYCVSLIDDSGTLTIIIPLKANYTQTIVVLAVFINLVIVFIALKLIGFIKGILAQPELITWLVKQRVWKAFVNRRSK